MSKFNAWKQNQSIKCHFKDIITFIWVFSDSAGNAILLLNLDMPVAWYQKL